MKRCYVLCEGQTEEGFVDAVLGDYLRGSHQFSIVTPVIVATKKPADGGKFRGGAVTWPRLQRELHLLLNDSGALTTTMIDLYGIGPDVPGSGLTAVSGSEKAVAIENAVAADFGARNFIPYIQVHEFEALMYASPEHVEQVCGKAGIAQLLQNDLVVGGPEDVNDSPLTAPSKRLKGYDDDYSKVSYGPRIAKLIGIPTLRAQCPHFDRWLTRLEQWRPPT